MVKDRDYEKRQERQRNTETDQGLKLAGETLILIELPVKTWVSTSGLYRSNNPNQPVILLSTVKLFIDFLFGYIFFLYN